MKPTIGRIVIYNTTEAEREAMRKNNDLGYCNVQAQLPAIVVAAWSETTLNLKVSLDGNSPDLWKTSALQGDGEGQWNWPVKSE